MLRDVPVYAVLVEDLGERGAHRVAYQAYLDIVKQPKEQPQTIDNRSARLLSILTIAPLAILSGLSLAYVLGRVVSRFNVFRK